MLRPAFQHPLQLGADQALYSATKYLLADFEQTLAAAGARQNAPGAVVF